MIFLRILLLINFLDSSNKEIENIHIVKRRKYGYQSYQLEIIIKWIFLKALWN